MAKRSFADEFWHKKTGNMFSTLQKRAGTPPFTLEQFREWAHTSLQEQIWSCCYCGRMFIHDKGAAAASLDHKLPLKASHDSSLNNLALCCKSCNEAKGGVMSDIPFRSLIRLLEALGPAIQADVLGRLARSTSVFIGRNRKRRG